MDDKKDKAVEGSSPKLSVFMGCKILKNTLVFVMFGQKKAGLPKNQPTAMVSIGFHRGHHFSTLLKATGLMWI